jgi:hypothetical protein
MSLHNVHSRAKRASAGPTEPYRDRGMARISFRGWMHRATEGPDVGHAIPGAKEEYEAPRRVRSLLAGAFGYLILPSDCETFKHAVQTECVGKSFLCGQALAHLLRDFHDADKPNRLHSLGFPVESWALRNSRRRGLPIRRSG